MTGIIHSGLGWFHTLSAVFAMLFGTVVLLRTKGTRFHKIVGYFYVFCMLSLNISSFFIINFNGYSIFHLFAIFSLLTVIAGIVPAILRTKNWFPAHFYFMNWSVVGLYCAFWSEVGTRFTTDWNQFWLAVVVATVLTAAIGGKLIQKKAKELKLK